MAGNHTGTAYRRRPCQPITNARINGPGRNATSHPALDPLSDITGKGARRACSHAPRPSCYTTRRNRRPYGACLMPRRASIPATPGTQIGRLTILAIIERGKHSKVAVKCECGKEKIVQLGNIRSGKTLSCGCIRRKQVAARNFVHGLAGTSEHNIWQSMRQRCENPNDARFEDYGGRGIAVCQRWQTFENFYADMGPRPQGRSIDRIDNDGNYEPGNCRWATGQQQAANRRPAKARRLSAACRRGHLYQPGSFWVDYRGSRSCLRCVAARSGGSR